MLQFFKLSNVPCVLRELEQTGEQRLQQKSNSVLLSNLEVSVTGNRNLGKVNLKTYLVFCFVLFLKCF